jgi:hypothetical protein
MAVTIFRAVRELSGRIKLIIIARASLGVQGGIRIVGTTTR